MKALLIAITACLFVAGCQDQPSSTISKIQSEIHDVIEIHKQKVVTIRDRNDEDRVGSGVLFTRQMPDNKDQIEYIVVTNNHVLEGVKDFEVILHAEPDCHVGSKGMELYGKDALSDLAVVGIKKEDMCPQTYAAFRLDEGNIEPKVGHFVIAIGATLGYQDTATFGIVSATNRVVDGYLAKFIQIDAPINLGNSGGALIDVNGNLLGINMGIGVLDNQRRGNSPGFALEWRFVRPIVNQLIEYREVQRVDLGIRLKDKDTCVRYKSPNSTTGCYNPVVYSGVEPLKPDDLIQSVNGRRVYDPIDFWIEASLVTRMDGEAEISYIDLESSERPTTKRIPIPVSSRDGFSIPVEYLPDIVGKIINKTDEVENSKESSNLNIYLREIQGGVRVEFDNQDFDIIRISDLSVHSLSSLINSINQQNRVINQQEKIIDECYDDTKCFLEQLESKVLEQELKSLRNPYIEMISDGKSSRQQIQFPTPE